MNRCVLARFAALAALALFSLPAVPLFSQSEPGAAKPSSPAETTETATKTWAVSHTPDGQPDLQGMWVNFDSTPLEKPLPGEGPSAKDPVLSFTDQAPVVAKRQSLVVDPKDGRVPLTAWAEQKRDYAMAHVQDSWEYDSPWTRCITRGVPSGMLPIVYDNGYQIFQTPGYVVILSEMIHEARIIPIDGRSHVPDEVRQWNGDPRGHWEGNTLVVETTNFNGRGMIVGLSRRVRSIPETEAAYVVERFTRIDANTINYEMTIRDPAAYTVPWTVAMPLTRDDKYRMFEYACHEGNQNYMEIHLGAGRQQEKAAEESGDKKE